MMEPSCVTARCRVASSFIMRTASMMGRSPAIATTGLTHTDLDGSIGIQAIGDDGAREDGIGDEPDIGLIVRQKQRPQLVLLHQLPGLAQARIPETGCGYRQTYVQRLGDRSAPVGWLEFVLVQRPAALPTLQCSSPARVCVAAAVAADFRHRRSPALRPSYSLTRPPRPIRHTHRRPAIRTCLRARSAIRPSVS